MTGWRLGWMVVPVDLLRAVECLAQNLFISAPTLSQVAAVAAFDAGAELDRNVARYARNRAVLLNELPAAGLTDLAPAGGAFYIYADVAHLTDESAAFCRRMLDEIGVACTPGSISTRPAGCTPFGCPSPAPPRTWSRLSPSQDLAEGLGAILAIGQDADGVEAAVYIEHLAGHPGGQITGQIEAGAADLVEGDIAAQGRATLGEAIDIASPTDGRAGSVRIGPAEIALTRMLSPPKSAAR